MRSSICLTGYGDRIHVAFLVQTRNLYNRWIINSLMQIDRLWASLDHGGTVNGTYRGSIMVIISVIKSSICHFTFNFYNWLRNSLSQSIVCICRTIFWFIFVINDRELQFNCLLKKYQDGRILIFHSLWLINKIRTIKIYIAFRFYKVFSRKIKFFTKLYIISFFLNVSLKKTRISYQLLRTNWIQKYPISSLYLIFNF